MKPCSQSAPSDEVLPAFSITISNQSVCCWHQTTLPLSHDMNQTHRKQTVRSLPVFCSQLCVSVSGLKLSTAPGSPHPLPSCWSDTFRFMKAAEHRDTTAGSTPRWHHQFTKKWSSDGGGESRPQRRKWLRSKWFVETGSGSKRWITRGLSSGVSNYPGGILKWSCQHLFVFFLLRTSEKLTTRPFLWFKV